MINNEIVWTQKTQAVMADDEDDDDNADDDEAGHAVGVLATEPPGWQHC